MDSVTYEVGSGCLALAGASSAITEFADAFLSRCEHGSAHQRLLARIVLVGPGPSTDVDGDRAQPHASALVRRRGDDYLVGGLDAGSEPDRGDVAAVIRKLAREIWLAKVATATWYVHAAAVDNGRHVIVFVGTKRAGKTTLLLDSVMRHGYSLLTNDGLMLCLVNGSITLAPLPTLAKLRHDTARDAKSWLAAAAGRDPFNAAQYRRWSTATADADGDTSLYLTFAALGRPFSEVSFNDRVVTFVDIRFGNDGVEKARHHGVDPPATVRLLTEHRKPLLPTFPDVVGLATADEHHAAGVVGQIAARAGYAEFAHQGRVAPLLAALATRPPRQANRERSYAW